jgi:hypothetical protein
MFTSVKMHLNLFAHEEMALWLHEQLRDAQVDALELETSNTRSSLSRLQARVAALQAELGSPMLANLDPRERAEAE